MKYIVLEEKDKDDKYIAVISADAERSLKAENKKCSIHYSRERAMKRAKELCELYKVRCIWLFQNETVTAFT
jgi:hypothetical protein